MEGDWGTGNRGDLEHEQANGYMPELAARISSMLATNVSTGTAAITSVLTIRPSCAGINDNQFNNISGGYYTYR
jgi:hypothetical protein